MAHNRHMQVHVTACVGIARRLANAVAYDKDLVCVSGVFGKTCMRMCNQVTCEHSHVIAGVSSEQQQGIRVLCAVCVQAAALTACQTGQARQGENTATQEETDTKHLRLCSFIR